MSTQRCVESAMALLSLQETLHQDVKAIESAKASHTGFVYLSLAKTLYLHPWSFAWNYDALKERNVETVTKFR